MKIKEGTVFYINHGGRQYKVHVLNVVSDGESKIITYKWWAKTKNRWIYEAEKLEVIEWFLDAGTYTATRQ